MKYLSLAAIIAFLADQASKYYVIHVLGVSPIKYINVWPPLLTFRYGENRGVNFGLFSDESDMTRWILVAVASVICIGILVWVLRSAQPRIVNICAGFLIGGALGNVLDRVYFGYVLDFLNSSCCGFHNPTVYNVADIFIFLGAIGLVFFSKDPPNKKKDA